MSCELTTNVWIGSQFCPQNWLPQQCPLRDQKNDFRSFIHSHLPSLQNSVKIGLVDAEIIGLTEIVKKLNIKKENSSILQANIRLHFELQGGLIMHSICLCKK